MERTTLRDRIEAHIAFREARRIDRRREAMKDRSDVAGKPDDQKIIQAKRLWDLGFGVELGKKSFEEYLKDIPEIPESLKPNDPDHPLLTLCDPRPGLANSCEIIGILFSYENDVVPFDDRHVTPQTPFWVRFDDGHRNRIRWSIDNRCSIDFRKECTGDVFAGTAMVGIMAYVHHPDIVKDGEHVLDLPGSVCRAPSVSCVYLRLRGGWTELSAWDYGRNTSYSGPGSFRRE